MVGFMLRGQALRPRLWTHKLSAPPVRKAEVSKTEGWTPWAAISQTPYSYKMPTYHTDKSVQTEAVVKHTDSMNPCKKLFFKSNVETRRSPFEPHSEN